MISPAILLRDLLRTEHAIIARQFAEARTEQQVSQAAEDALSFVSSLLLERDSDRGHHNFLGTPFWYFTSAEACLGNHLAFTGKALKLNDDDRNDKAGLASLARQLKEYQLIMLREVSYGSRAKEAAIVVVDVSLVNKKQFLTFLFGFALGRMPGENDIAALRSEITIDTDDRIEVFSNLCRIVIGSEEAAATGRCWQQV